MENTNKTEELKTQFELQKKETSKYHKRMYAGYDYKPKLEAEKNWRASIKKQNTLFASIEKRGILL